MIMGVVLRGKEEAGKANGASWGRSQVVRDRHGGGNETNLLIRESAKNAAIGDFFGKAIASVWKWHLWTGSHFLVKDLLRDAAQITSFLAHSRDSTRPFIQALIAFRPTDRSTII